MLTVLDLFSGIGAFSLGLEWTGGFETVAFCEIEPFQRSVLAKHWPGVKCYHDIRELSAQHLTADGIVPDVICGGFPCQDISIAGRGAGLAGERSGLWSEFARLIGEVRPRFVIVENVSALLGRGIGDVLGDLASIGYDAEWHCIPASAIGAPHQRDRVWIVGYANWTGFQGVRMVEREGWQTHPEVDRSGSSVGEPCRPRLAIGPGSLRERAYAATSGTGWWATEPDVGRVVDGPADKVDRRKRLIGLGNSLVPQIPEMIGRAILAIEAETKTLEVIR